MEKKEGLSQFKLMMALGLAAALTVFVVYLPALHLGFVEWWDDQRYVTANPLIRHIDAAFFKTVFTKPVFSNWHPLTIMSYAVDYAIWGLNPFGYHLVNVVLHAANTLLVYILALKIFNTASLKDPVDRADYFAPASALLAAVLFGLHPIHVESVAWVAERKDVMSFFFSVLAMLAYMKYAGSDKKALYYILTMFLFALSLMSKAMAVTLPLVFLILDGYPLGRLAPGSLRSWVRLSVEKAPFFAMSVGVAVLTIWAQQHGMVQLERYPLAWRVAIAADAYFFYIWKMVFPYGLIPIYPRPDFVNPLDLKYLIEYLGFISITVLSIRSFLKLRPLGSAWLFYVVTLLPVIGIVSVGVQAAADRYTYFPSVSLAMLVAVICGRAVTDKRRLKIFIAVLAVLSVSLGWLTVKQIATWKDSISMWSQEIKYRPIVQAYSNRAGAYMSAGLFDKAASDYTAVIEKAASDPTVIFKAYTSRADAYKRARKLDRAISDYLKAIELNPGYITAYNNLGNAYSDMKEYGMATRVFEAALKFEPDNAVVNFNLALTYRKMGNTAMSNTYMRKAAELGVKEARDYLMNAE